MEEQEVVTGQPAPVVAADAPEVKAPETAEAPPVESKPQDEVAETKKALRGVQKRINELTRERHAAEERGRAEAEYWRNQAQAHAQRLQEIERSAPGPRFDQFNDIEAYSQAVAQHESQKAVQAALDQERQQQAKTAHEMAQRQQQIVAQQNFERVLAQKLEAATKKFPDFVEVVSGEDLPGIRDTPAFAAILDSEVGAEVMYYLGKNPVKAHQLVGLSPIGQVREIARIEQAIQSGKLVSSAPPPPETINGGKGSGPKTPEQMSYDEFVAWRRKSIAQRR